MNQYICDLEEVVREAHSAFEKKDIQKLARLSDRAVDCTALYQDKYSMATAVMIYSLSKLLSKESSYTHKQWNVFYQHMLIEFKKARTSLAQNNLKDYGNVLKNTLNLIKSIDKKTSNYIRDLISSARVKKGNKLYELGISLGKSAELLGTSQWDLMDYVGITKNLTPLTKSVIERVDYAKKIFNVE